MKKIVITIVALTLFVGIVKADLFSNKSNYQPIYAKLRVCDNGSCDSCPNCPSCDNCPSCPQDSSESDELIDDKKHGPKQHLRYKYIEKYNYNKNKKGIERFNYNERLNIRGKGMKPNFSPLPKK